MDIIDNLNRALSFSKSNKDFDSLMKGIDITLSQFNKVLLEEGVKPIEAIDKKFDANLHHAVAYENDDDLDDNTVIEELSKGYTMKDRVIKHTMVKVSKKQKDVKNG